MKKGKLMNSEIAYEIAKMGHTDGLVIADCGLPIPNDVKRIDLALTKDIPKFIDVFNIIASELCIEEVIIAHQMHSVSPELFKEFQEIINRCEKESGKKIKILEVDHDEFKKMTHDARCIVRTGECTPYANVILKSGVVF